MTRKQISPRSDTHIKVAKALGSGCQSLDQVQKQIGLSSTAVYASVRTLSEKGFLGKRRGCYGRKATYWLVKSVDDIQAYYDGLSPDVGDENGPYSARALDEHWPLNVANWSHDNG